MPAGPAKAAELIHTVLSVTAPPRPLREVLLDIILTHLWAVGADAEDKADIWLARFRRRLAFIAAEAMEEGKYRSFTFNSATEEYVQGYCFVEPSDAPAVVEAKRKRANTIHIFEHVSRITELEFEVLSGKVLELLRVEEAFVSRRS